MAVTPGFLGIDEPATIDKRADTNVMTRAATVVHREVVSIGSPDDATPESIAKVDLTGSLRTASTDAAGTNQQAITAAGDAKVTLDGEAVVLGAGAANIGDVDVLTVPAPLSTTGGGTEATALRVTLANDSTGLVSVDDNGASLTVDNTVLSVVGGGTEATAQRVTIANDSTGLISVDDNGSSLTVDGTVTANAGTGTRDVQGNVANDSADSGNPVKIGGKATDANPTAVTADDRVNAYFDRQGRQITRPWGASPWTQVHFPAVNTRATTTKAAGAAGNRHVCTGITAILAGGATTPAAIQLDVRLRDGIADTGTILWQGVITLPGTAGAMNGITRTALHIFGTAATAMTLEFSAAGGSNTFESVSMEGVTIVEA